MPNVTEFLGAQFDKESSSDVKMILGNGSCTHTLNLLSIILHRSEHFKACLSSTFAEGIRKEIVLSDVDPKQMLPLLRALYTDTLADDDCEYLTFHDYFEMLLLCSRFLFPTITTDIVTVAFQESLTSATLYTRDEVEQVWDLLGRARRLDLPASVVEALHTKLQSTLKWGSNILRSVLRAYELDLPGSVELCLQVVQDRTVSNVRAEFATLKFTDLRVGSKVEVMQTFTSNNGENRKDIPLSSKGCVSLVDHEGDVIIDFEMCGGIEEHWVMADDFHHLRITESPEYSMAPSVKLVAQAKMAMAEKLLKVTCNDTPKQGAFSSVKGTCPTNVSKESVPHALMEVLVQELSSSMCSLMSISSDPSNEPAACSDAM